ncbi:hypothetical protein ILT44_22945 [Microvirga sp. BT689]|uniref:hypothetical protein n=1 Tax=Microvirga arvi TaxID=2778731 RepID=UPI00194DE0FE|nr:hypothetical protein [Microvirga arvi]MBM6583063.1 hypothetical protein [Microvirga arvi]
MPSDQRPSAAPIWTIRSVSVRTRDGSERLDHAYRRLLSFVPSQSPLDPDDASPVPGRAPEPRR